MYTDHFGFRERPFDITIAPHFFFTNPAHEEAYAALLYGVRERRGCIVLIGEAGTGKTTVLRRLMDNLDDSIRLAFFDKTTLTFDELLDFICQAFNLPVKTGRRLEKIQGLNEFLLVTQQKGGTGVLIIDEAQNLADEMLENLRLLSNFEAANEKLLQIILVGQPELEKKLERPELRQLKQRIVVRCQLDHLKPQDVGSFIHHRLRVAGCEREDLFTTGAIRRVALYSNGIPRLVNTLCDNALLSAYGARLSTVSAEIVEEAARDLRLVEGLSALTAPPRRQSSETLNVLQRIETEASPDESPLAPRPFPSSAFPLWARPVSWGVGVALLSGLLLLGFEDVSTLVHSTLTRITALRFEDVSTLVHSTLTRIAAVDSSPSPPAAAQRQEEENRASSPSVSPPPTPSTPPASLPGPGEAFVKEAPQPLVAQPAVSLPSSNTLASEWKGERVTIGRGDTISEIATKMYGSHNILAFDLIKELNPHIKDLDRLAVGEQVWFPALVRETLLRQQDDGSYRLILGAFVSEGDAARVAAAARRQGYTAIISQQRVFGTRSLHRVELEGLKDLTAVDRAWRFIDLG